MSTLAFTILMLLYVTALMSVACLIAVLCSRKDAARLKQLQEEDEP